MAKVELSVVRRSIREQLEKFAAEGDAEAARLLLDRDRRESLATLEKVVAPASFRPRNRQIGAFASGTVAHGLLCDRIVAILRNSVQPDSEVFTSDIALRHADAATYVFPDALYADEMLDPDADSIVSPSLIVEVMSPQSVERDRAQKLDSYQSIPSVLEYVIVDSRRFWASIYRRHAGTWIQEIFRPGDTIELSTIIGCSIGLAELYAGINPGS